MQSDKLDRYHKLGPPFLELFTFFGLLGTRQPLKGNARISSQTQISLINSINTSSPCSFELFHHTLPNGPSPIRNKSSTFSLTISVFAFANMPRIIMAPRRCALGIFARVNPIDEILIYTYTDQSFFIHTYHKPTKACQWQLQVKDPQPSRCIIIVPATWAQQEWYWRWGVLNCELLCWYFLAWRADHQAQSTAYGSNREASFWFPCLRHWYP